MNTRTGEIREFNEGEKIPPGFVPIDKRPEATCWKCNGRGGKFNGRKWKPCACTKIKGSK
jgi:hypothetical protein